MKAIERDSNYLRPHGAYMEDWRDADGWIWKQVMPVSATVARAMLSTALIAEAKANGEDVYLSELQQSAEHGYLTWLQVGNKDIVVYHVNDDKVFALTNRDGRLYVIVGDFNRIQGYADKHVPQFDSEKRLNLALLTLGYDVNDHDLHTRCLF